MKIYMDTDLAGFEAWQGATETKNKIIEAGKAEEFENWMEDENPEGLSETALNDFLWFESDYIYSVLGIDSDDSDDSDD